MCEKLTFLYYSTSSVSATELGFGLLCLIALQTVEGSCIGSQCRTNGLLYRSLRPQSPTWRILTVTKLSAWGILLATVFTTGDKVPGQFDECSGS